MQKILNGLALIVIVVLFLRAYTMPETVLFFLAAGVIPGTSIFLSPTMMLSILTVTSGIMISLILFGRDQVFSLIRKFIASLPDMFEKLRHSVAATNGSFGRFSVRKVTRRDTLQP